MKQLKCKYCNHGERRHRVEQTNDGFMYRTKCTCKNCECNGFGKEEVKE